MKHLLLEAAHEIEALRRRNEYLQAKVDVVEVFSAALLGPRTPMGASVDVVWSLRRKAEELDASIAKEATDVPPGPKAPPRSPGDKEVG